VSDADGVLGEIIDLARKQTGAKTITANTRLYADLGMTGDDAQEFMTAFAVKYDVDMSEFVWLRYFDDEGSDMMGPAIVLAASVLSASFAVRWQAAHDAEREITIGHLVGIAGERTWRDPGDAYIRKRNPIVLTLILSTVSLVVSAFFVLGSAIVLYALLAGELGETNLLVVFGVVATGLVFPWLAYTSWRNIQRKLASAEAVRTAS
jgi:hypothetical protein